MTDLDEIKGEIGNIIRPQWTTREGEKVPETTEVELGNSAVKLAATVLFADLIESTTLVNTKRDNFAAEVYKSFLRAACRVIMRNGGTITAFDGDRVMAVYLGNSKNTQAVGSALEINYVVREIINPMIKEIYPKSSYEIRQVIGVDTSPLFVARAGVRGSNDLVWIGRAANYAAKLSSLREPDCAQWITADVHEAIANREELLRSGKGVELWTRYDWTGRGMKIFGANAWRWT
jgi:class 3 adenylate cyclase